MNKVKLGDLAIKISSGLTPSRANIDYWKNGTIDWIKTEQIGQKYVYSSNEKISNLALEKTSIKLNPINTLSIAMYGEGKTRGSVSILKVEATTNQACCNIIVDDELADTEFLYYKLKTQYENLRSLSSGVRKNLNSNDIKEFEISIPKLLTQQKIATVLSVFDDKIELNNKINAELEAMAKTLYDYWFVQFDFPNGEGKPYRSSGGKMVFNETLKREIPEGWEVNKFKFLVNKVSNTINPDEYLNLKYLPIDKIPKKSFLYSEYEDRNNALSSIIKFDEDDILLGAMRVYFHRVCLALESGISRNTIFVLRAKNEIYKFYSLMLLNKDESIQFANDNSTGSSIPYSKWDNGLAELNCIIPPNNLLKDFNVLLFPILEKVKNLSKQNQELAQLRDWLLPMLMNGQVKASEVRIGDRINEYANSEVSHEKLVAETFGEYLPKKQHNINDINKELAALVYLMNYGLGVNYGNVAVQKAVYNSSVITPNLYSKKHDFINYNFGTFSKGLADDLSHNPYLKTKKINGFEVYEIEPSKKNEILNVLSSAENKDFVSSINKLIDLYKQPFINKETNKMELLNTVLKIHSDLKTTDIEIVYQAMKDWKIKQTGFNTKAEKFSKEDTEQIIELLQNNGII